MWADILSGAFTGANRGLGQVQDMRQQQFTRDQDAIRTQLAQKQQEQAMAEQKRRAVMEAYDKLHGGYKFEKPQDAQQYLDIGLPLEKDPTGVLIKPKSRQEQLIEAQMANADLERQQNALKLHAYQEVTAPGFYSRPITDRQGWAGLAGVKSQLPAEETANSKELATANVRAMYAGMPRSNDPDTERLNQQKFLASLRVDAMNMAKPSSGMFKTPQQIQADAEMYYQQLVRDAGIGQPPPVAGAAGGGIAVGTTRMIQGRQARWDGQGWLPVQ
jgi:hypothetical protein